MLNYSPRDKNERTHRSGEGGGGFPIALGHIDVYQLGACYTRGARSGRCNVCVCGFNAQAGEAGGISIFILKIISRRISNEEYPRDVI